MKTKKKVVNARGVKTTMKIQLPFIISCDYDNYYGRPHDVAEVLQKLFQNKTIKYNMLSHKEEEVGDWDKLPSGKRKWRKTCFIYGKKKLSVSPQVLKNNEQLSVIYEKNKPSVEWVEEWLRNNDPIKFHP